MDVLGNVDMYAQFSERFPGIIIDEEKAVLRFSHERFAQEFNEYFEASSILDYFTLSEEASTSFTSFLAQDLSAYPMIHVCLNYGSS